MAIIQKSEMKNPKYRAIYIAIFIILCVGVVTNFLPLIWLGIGTFKTDAELISVIPKFFPETWSFNNYVEAFESFNVWGNVLNTCFFCGTIILAQTVTSTLAAYSLSFISKKCNEFFYMIFMGTNMISATALMFPLYIQITKMGLVNNKWSWVLMASGWGYAIVLYKDFFDGIPKDLLAAADIDGAGNFRKILHILIPLSKPIFAVNILNTFMVVYNDFLLPMMILPNEDDWTLMMRIFAMNEAGNADQSVMYVLLFVTTIPSIVFYLFAQKNIVQGVAGSGIKG